VPPLAVHRKATPADAATQSAAVPKKARKNIGLITVTLIAFMAAMP
jgi:hypothetical protein